MKNSGFTLIELIIIIVIVSLLGLIGVRSFVSYQEGVEGTGEAQELINDLRYAKQMSISEQIHYGIVFDFEDNSYELIKEEEERVVIKQKKLPERVNLKPVDQYSEVRFTRFGAVFKSGEVILSDSSSSRKIIIKPSGFINVQRNNLN